MSNFKIIYQFKNGWPAGKKPDEVTKDIERVEQYLKYNDVHTVHIPCYINAILIDSEGRAVHL